MSASLVPHTHSQSIQRLRSCNRSSGLYRIHSCQQRYSSLIAAVAEAHGSSFAARKNLSCYYFSTECFHRCCFNSLSPISYRRSPKDWLAHPFNLQRNVVAVQTRETCQTKQDANQKKVEELIMNTVLSYLPYHQHCSCQFAPRKLQLRNTT